MKIEEYLGSLPRIVFFTGKGGVGKTSLACATGVALSDRGKKVLLVSTDPASNLDEVLGTRLESQPTPVRGCDRLFALNIDPMAAARVHREQILGPYRGILPESALASMEEQLSGACTVEIAAFNEFVKLLGEREITAAFDYIVFDTAPTGHTLRLLSLPAAWSEFIATNTTGTSCLGPLQGLQAQKELYALSLQNLADRTLTKVVLVSRPEDSSLKEADRTHTELSRIGIENQILILNGVFEADCSAGLDPVAEALARRCRAALEAIPPALTSLQCLSLPLLPRSPLGIDSLRGVFKPADSEDLLHSSSLLPCSPLKEFIDELEGAGQGLILMMGKGGVGKTTLASAVALELARRGCAVHLTTTDPAAHLDLSIGDGLPRIQISRIDPAVETMNYAQEVREAAEPLLDAQGMALLEEDLRSPCTEEIAVFRAFARTVASAQHQFVVVDTAPTGHTILLLDAAEVYHREVSRSKKESPEEVRNLLVRLRNPRFTRVFLVTLAEATPVHEAEHLAEDLKRAGIVPFAWIVNQTWAGYRVNHPVLVARQSNELEFIRRVRDVSADRFATVHWQMNEPKGVENLSRLIDLDESSCYPIDTLSIIRQ